MDAPPDPFAVEQALRRLNFRAAKALAAAREEAAAMRHAHVGAEHLLIGLAAQEPGVAGRVLANLCLPADKLRANVIFIVGAGEASDTVLDHLPLTPRLQHALLTADAESSKRGQTQIGTIHLLVGIVKERAGLAVALLQVPGVGLERIGSEILRAVREGARDES